MGKIKERRERTANTNVENKAVLAEAPAKVKEFPYKKILIAVLAVVAVIACALLIINAVVDSKAAKLANGAPVDGAVATVEVKGTLYENTITHLEHAAFRKAYIAASENHNKYVGNAKSDANIYNFVVTINDATAGANSSNLVITMILSFNKAENKVTYVTVNKGTLVEIPSTGKVGPLHDSYRFGGAALLARAIQDNYGININGYVDMTLDSFVEASEDLGGITVADTKLATKNEIYDYVKNAEDRDAATKEVVSALASGAKDAGIMGLGGMINTIADTITANISRNDVGSLIGMGVGVFKAEATVVSFAYDDAVAVDLSGTYAQFAGLSTPASYQTAIENLQKALGYAE